MGDLDKFLPLHANELLFWLPSAHAATLPLNPSPHTSGLPHIQQSHNKKKKYKKTLSFLLRRGTIHHLTFSPVCLPHLLEKQVYCKSY